MSIRFNKLMAAAVQRAHLLMSETPSLVTLISESGLVLVQNEASVSYYGNLEGSSVAALGIKLQAGSSPCLKPCPVEGLLRLLLKFAPPGLLEELLQAAPASQPYALGSSTGAPLPTRLQQQPLNYGLVVALPEGTHDTQIDVGQGGPLPALHSAASGEQPQYKLSSGQVEEPLPSSPRGGSSPSLVVEAGCGYGALHSSSLKHPARGGLADAMQLIVEDDRESAGTGHEQGLEAVPGLVRTSMSTQLLAEALHLAKASAADEQPFYMTSQEQVPHAAMALSLLL
ncbi:hypothetical protein HaLaN_21111 [Haematococcus lacustris]|uniref:Uncharacterized protein n=1 Tax=Haematococcus lacustris TaxID=44745 RepID=A0A699ZXR6_HAELA|nr:hypothetical protein HaLaN_21111 [Haematococcus lacustris]